MASDQVSVPHYARHERMHMAQEVAEARADGVDDKHGAKAAEEFVRGLLPWAASNALGVDPRYPRRHQGWSPKGGRNLNIKGATA